MTVAFALDPRIAAASLPCGETPLCLVRMMDDRRYPWLVLVPRRAGVVELFDLDAADRHRLVDEAAALARSLATSFAATKVNVAALGNKVRQFHLHLIVRQPDDPSWPDGVWNGSAAEPYSATERDFALERMRACVTEAGL